MSLITIVIAQTIMFHTARWSPEGNQLLVTRLAADHQVRAYIVDIARNALRTVGGAEQRRLEAAWAIPVGTREVIERRTGSGQAIALRDRVRGTVRIVSREPWAEQPSLAPDDRQIVYEGRENSHDVLSSWVVVVDTSGANRKRLYRGTDPSWSPDGRRILFKTPVERVLYVATIPATGGRAALLATGVHPAWSPDARRISFMHETRERSDLDHERGWLRQALRYVQRATLIAQSRQRQAT